MDHLANRSGEGGAYRQREGGVEPAPMGARYSYPSADWVHEGKWEPDRGRGRFGDDDAHHHGYSGGGAGRMRGRRPWADTSEVGLFAPAGARFGAAEMGAWGDEPPPRPCAPRERGGEAAEVGWADMLGAGARLSAFASAVRFGAREAGASARGGGHEAGHVDTVAAVSRRQVGRGRGGLSYPPV